MKNHISWEKISYKKIALTMLGLFFISLIPVMYCSFFDYATGDDLWVGAAAYRVLANNGTIKEFIAAVYEWAKGDYLGWEGTWSSIILWSLEPSIWGEKVYCITPWIALIFLCGGSGYFLFHYLKKYLSDSWEFLIIVSVIICFFSVHYIPSIGSGIFWYTAMVHYVVPYGLCLAAFVWMDKFLEKGKKSYLIMTSIVFLYVGGAGYAPIVLAFLVSVAIIMIHICSHEAQKRRRAYKILFPLFLLSISFAFSAMSPGNAVRGGDNYYFSIGKVVVTVLKAVEQGFLGGIKWFLTVRPLVLSFPILMIVTWEKVDIDKVRLKIKYPFIVLLGLFLISCSVYAPGIYAQVGDMSGGTPNSIYFVFLMCYVLGTIYLTCYIKKVFINTKGKNIAPKLLEKFRGIVILCEILFCLVAGRHLIGNMTGYICVEFIKSGQLSDFEYQMQERLAILHDPEITNVVLPEMNNEQGPFVHMALLDDPTTYTNMATARFYGKESVVAIPRTEYYEKYGYPE